MKHPLFLAFVFLCLTHAVAEPLGRQSGLTAGHAVRTQLSDMQRPVGIEGNGQPLGIEGNGVTQRIGEDGVVVNETLYALQSPSVAVTIDDQQASLAAVLPGQVARVVASQVAVGSSVALTAVRIDNLVRGPIDDGGIDLEASTLTVLGQTLPVADFVELGDASGELSLDDMTAGDYVTVSGFVDAAGAVLATRIQRSSSAAVLEVTGQVAELDVTQLSLRVGTLPIDISTTQFVGLTVEELSTGDRVEVVGDVVTGIGELIAQRIRRVPAWLGARAGQRAEHQGFIETAPVDGLLTVSGTSVLVSAATEYERGVAADLQPGRLVEVEGNFDGADTLVAARVEFDEEPLESEIRIASVVTNVDVTNAQFNLLGLQATIGLVTRLEDNTDSGTPFSHISDLAPGQFVELRAYDDPDGAFSLAATRVTRKMPDETLLRGRVSSSNGSEISVLGRLVQTTQETEYSDLMDHPISAAEFFAAAQPGALVKARGTAMPGGIVALKLDLE